MASSVEKAKINVVEGYDFSPHLVRCVNVRPYEASIPGVNVGRTHEFPTRRPSKATLNKMLQYYSPGVKHLRDSITRVGAWRDRTTLTNGERRLLCSRKEASRLRSDTSMSRNVRKSDHEVACESPIGTPLERKQPSRSSTLASSHTSDSCFAFKIALRNRYRSTHPDAPPTSPIAINERRQALKNSRGGQRRPLYGAIHRGRSFVQNTGANKLAVTVYVPTQQAVPSPDNNEGSTPAPTSRSDNNIDDLSRCLNTVRLLSDTTST